MDTIRAFFFPKNLDSFYDFQKRAGEASFSPPSCVPAESLPNQWKSNQTKVDVLIAFIFIKEVLYKIYFKEL